MTKDARETRLAALTRLALRTREKVEKETYVLYLEDTQHFSTAAVTEACDRWGRANRWFPTSSELLAECRTVAIRHQEQQEDQARKALLPPPISAEKHAEIMAKFRDVLRHKTMR